MTSFSLHSKYIELLFLCQFHFYSFLFTVNSFATQRYPLCAIQHVFWNSDSSTKYQREKHPLMLIKRLSLNSAMLININCSVFGCVCVAALYYRNHLVECGNHKDAQYVRLECNLNICMAIYIKYALWREYVTSTAIVCKPTNREQFRRNFRINNYDVHRPQACMYV